MPSFLYVFLASSLSPHVCALSILMTAISPAYPQSHLKYIHATLFSLIKSCLQSGETCKPSLIEGISNEITGTHPGTLFYTRREEIAHLNRSSENHCVGIGPALKRFNHKIAYCPPCSVSYHHINRTPG